MAAVSKWRHLCNAKFIFCFCFLWAIVLVLFYTQSISLGFLPKVVLQSPNRSRVNVFQTASAAPSSGKESPPDKDSPPLVKDSLPSGKESPPLVKDSLPSGNESPPPGKESPPSGKDSLPSGNETPPSGNELPSSGNESPPSGKESPPSGKESPPSGKESPPSGKDSTPSGKESPPPSKGPSPSTTAVKQQCIIPKLKIADPVMMKHFKSLPPTKCAGEKDWVEVNNGTVQIALDALKAHKGLTCDYYPLKRVNDYKVEFVNPVKNVSSGFKTTTDGFKMVCTDKAGKTYDNVHHGVAFNPEFANRPQPPLPSGLEGMNIAILGFDSMSRMSWLRRLPETRKYFVDKLGAIELESHNILGDGTTAVMFPMLTGKFEWELPECRRKFKGAKTMDKFPWIWHDFKKAGYLTSWSNAAPGSAPFNWRMLGFSERPTDFYARDFYLAAYPRFKKSTKWCLRSKTRSRLWLDYFRDIFHMYKQQRKFLFHFITDMSHDDNNLMTMLDGDIKNSIQHLQEGGYLNNTLLILMGDHGARYFQVRSTVAGKLEERLPYFSFLFPPWFEKKYPDAIKNLRTNAKRLTTPFDLYYTFKDFLNFTGTGMGNTSHRGMSLFKEVPLSRTCENAAIAPHWCACLAWTNVSLSDPGAKDALHVALDTINGYTAKYRSDCALLSIANVTMATKLETRSELLKFSNADQNGGIYKINFNSKNKNQQTLYQLTFFTTPGGGHFEVTVTHDLVKNKYLVSEKEISRINMYGDAPHCVLDRNRQIRQYCYCKDLIKS